MGFLVALAAFFQQYGLWIMMAAFAAMFLVPSLMARGKLRAAQWALFALMVLSGILAFSQLTLGAVTGNLMLVAFGAVCLWPMVRSFQHLKGAGFWRRLRRSGKRSSRPKDLN